MTTSESPFEAPAASSRSVNSSVVSVAGLTGAPEGGASRCGDRPPGPAGAGSPVASGLAAPRDARAGALSGSAPALASSEAAVPYRESVQNGFSEGDPASAEATITKQMNGASRTCDALAENVRADA